MSRLLCRTGEPISCTPIRSRPRSTPTRIAILCGPPNTARFLFLDPRARTFYLEWEKVANETVAVLRGAAGRNPYDRALSDLVGLLSTRSAEFRVRWASHDVRFHRSGT